MYNFMCSVDGAPWIMHLISLVVSAPLWRITTVRYSSYTPTLYSCKSSNESLMSLWLDSSWVLILPESCSNPKHAFDEKSNDWKMMLSLFWEPASKANSLLTLINEVIKSRHCAKCLNGGHRFCTLNGFIYLLIHGFISAVLTSTIQCLGPNLAQVEYFPPHVDTGHNWKKSCIYLTWILQSVIWLIYPDSVCNGPQT